MMKRFSLRLTALLMFAFCGVFAADVRAATFTVSTTADSGPGSLRQAVNDANAANTDDTIVFASGLSGQTIVRSSEIQINNNGTLIVDGLGANLLTVDGGGAINPIFFINGATATIRRLTLTGGRGSGGALYAFGGTAILEEVVVKNNIGDQSTGAVYFNGGTNHRIVGSTFAGNTGFTDCAAFYALNGASLTVSNSTFSGNSTVAGGYGAGAICFNNSTGTFRHSTIAGNAANGAGGGGGGGIYIQFGSTVNLGNTIVAGNAGAGSGTDLFRYDGESTFTTSGGNLIGDNSGNPTHPNTDAFPTGNPNANGDKVGATGSVIDPLLAPLDYYGGTTPTRALLAGSPAIDAGLNSLAVDPSDGSALVFDQRGTGFSRVVDRDGNGTAAVDIGAFESQTNVTISGRITSNGNALSGVTVALSGSATASVTTDASGDYSFTVNADGNYTITPSLTNYTFTPVNAAFNNLAANQTANFTAVNQTAAGYSVSGSVTYGITAASQTPSAVSGVNLNAAGSSVLSAITDSAGNYQLSGLISGGNYTVTPSKTGEVRGINSLDATRIQQHLVGLTTLTANQLLAADTDGNGTVNSLDATRIQQRLVGIQSANVIGQWKFVPANRQYNSVSSDFSGQNYEAVLVGEVSGNWATASSFAEDAEIKGEEILSKQQENFNNAADRNAVTVNAGNFRRRLAEPSAGRTEQSADLPSVESESESVVAGTSVAVSLPMNATAAMGSTITVPVSIGAVPSGTSIESFDFTLFYDPTVLQPVSPVGSNAGTLSAQCSVLSNSPSAGRVIVSGACAQTITTASGGALYNLRFTVIGNPGQQTALSFVNPANNTNTFVFNNGTPAAVTTNGSFAVMVTTAASVSVSGKVTTASGRGIRNATMTLTDASGNERTARTTAFGYYRFDDVSAGETVTISAKAKRYRFNQASIVRTTAEQISDADFVSID